jgi:nucleotidyltransferase substrate binding protein (TIGR01987 family)
MGSLLVEVLYNLGMPPMNTAHDIRWQQRFTNFKRATAQLKKFLTKESLNELEEQGLIQAFEYTHELAWKTLKDFLASRGNIQLFGSKDSTREAIALGLIQSGDVWMHMIESRNLSSHTYNHATTERILHAIRHDYAQAFYDLETTLDGFAA